MKVYVVSSWVAYDGSNIEGVFSSEEKAQQYISLISTPKNVRENYCGFDIEEHEVE